MLLPLLLSAAGFSACRVRIVFSFDYVLAKQRPEITNRVDVLIDIGNVEIRNVQLAVRGGTLSRFDIIEMCIRDRRDSYPPLLIAYIRKGRFRVEYRGEFHVAEAGDVLLLDCIEPHYYHAEDGLEFVYMHFEGSNARELCRRITDRHGWLSRRDNNTLIGNLLYDMVRFYDENGVETDMQRSARIYRMFDLLLSPSAAEQSADTPVEQAIQYIRSHIGQPISVEELASTVCLSASYFAHMFKRHTGFSPADYVINSRIERAKVLLVRTQKPIAEIAEEVGYSTSGSLINLFVKKVGTSPRQYRIDVYKRQVHALHHHWIRIYDRRFC